MAITIPSILLLLVANLLMLGAIAPAWKIMRITPKERNGWWFVTGMILLFSLSYLALSILFLFDDLGLWEIWISALMAAGSIYCYVTLVLALDTIQHSIRETVRASHVAMHDPLTELLNRRGFELEIEKVFNSNAKPSWLLLLDLDNFKATNDALGHQVGDTLLNMVAQRLKNSAPDATVCRLGGDEFTLIVPRTNDNHHLADNILGTLSRPYMINNQRITTSASIGMVKIPEDADTLPKALSYADIAMYYAKSHQLGTCCYQGDLNSTPNQEILQISDLSMELYYQPIMDTERGTPVAIEALLRCQASGTSISPEVLLQQPHAEQLQKKITDWVLDRACADYIHLKQQPYTCNLHINLTGADLNDPLLFVRVRTVLSRYQLSPADCVFEVPESTLLNVSHNVQANMLKLSALGLRWALDDFGTGHSALAALRSLPLSYIKIGRTFINGIDLHEKDRTLIESIVQLGTALGCEAIAEGIEQTEEAELLQQYGCKALQGFLFSAPMSTASTIHWLRHHYHSTKAA